MQIKLEAKSSNSLSLKCISRNTALLSHLPIL